MQTQQSTGPGAQLRTSLTTARDAFSTVGEELASLTGADLAALMTLADEVAARARAPQVQITAEAATRGEFTAARRGVGSGHDWVREHAPSLRQGGAGQVAQLAQEAAAATPAGSWVDGAPTAGAYADPDRPEGVVWARVATGEVSPALALTALREVAKLTDRLQPDAIPTVTTAVLDHGTQWGLGEAKKVRAALLARYGAQEDFDDLQRRLASAAFLSAPVVASGDVSEYRMAMTPEQAARLEAAIGPLSCPQPNPATGEADHRPAGQRRVEALHDILGAATGLHAGDHDRPGGASTVVHVTIPLTSLSTRSDHEPNATDLSNVTRHAPAPNTQQTVPVGAVLGSRVHGTMISVPKMRQLACDADLIPVVLGADGEVLDLGRATRLCRTGQRRALWHRDKHCTYPGCDMPATWAKAHHIVHWADGGGTDVDGCTLLCQRHHTQVHEQRLIATVHPPDEWGRSVTWDLTPGSYDRELPARQAELHRVRVQASRRTATSTRIDVGPSLDTGPPDGDRGLMPEEVQDQLIAEQAHLDAHRPEDHHIPWDICA